MLSILKQSKNLSVKSKKSGHNYRCLCGQCSTPVHVVLGLHHEPFPKQTLVFTCLQYMSFENTVGKGEIAHNEQFLLFSSMFSSHLDNFLPVSSDLKLSSANPFSLEES